MIANSGTFILDTDTVSSLEDEEKQIPSEVQDNDLSYSDNYKSIKEDVSNGTNTVKEISDYNKKEEALNNTDVVSNDAVGGGISLNNLDEIYLSDTRFEDDYIEDDYIDDDSYIEYLDTSDNDDFDNTDIFEEDDCTDDECSLYKSDSIDEYLDESEIFEEDSEADLDKLRKDLDNMFNEEDIEYETMDLNTRSIIEMETCGKTVSYGDLESIFSKVTCDSSIDLGSMRGYKFRVLNCNVINEVADNGSLIASYKLLQVLSGKRGRLLGYLLVGIRYDVFAEWSYTLEKTKSTDNKYIRALINIYTEDYYDKLKSRDLIF